MEVDKTTSRSGVTLSLRGELDHHAALAVRDMIRDTVEEDLPGKLVLDLSGLSFMDSSGIAVVMGARRDCDGIGAGFAVRGAAGTALRIFQAAGLPGRVTFE